MFPSMRGRLVRHALQRANLARGVRRGPVAQPALAAASPFSLRPPRLATRCFSGSTGVGITVARSKGKENGYCYGCGADLVKANQEKGVTGGKMATAPKKKGFWEEKKQLLKVSKLKNWDLCPRCKSLNGKQPSNDLIETWGPDSSMRQVFRTEVSKIRAQKAVVVLCVDASNVAGTLIRTIRNYVGGNPILLAVTRCDLLPDYVWDAKKPGALKQVFAERAADIQPAGVYLCSEEAAYLGKTGGLAQLTADLWEHLGERDVYVIGAANIGKSTLTDLLIKIFVLRGEKKRHFNDRQSKKRVETLRDSRVTKSALPGTTLQNIRVPCFQDHMQALWDTPGLLLDVSLSHFPIRNFRHIRAQRPPKIESQILEVPEKSFALLICEKDAEEPLLRIEVRLKKGAEGEGPVRLAWNSTLPLEAKIVDIREAHAAEKDRVRVLEERVEAQKQENLKQYNLERSEGKEQKPALAPKEKAARKAERRRMWEEKIKREQHEMGMKEWRRREKAKEALHDEDRRAKTLSKLAEVDQVIIDAGVGMDLEIANFGWIGILPARMAMVRTFAPSAGVKVKKTPALALPVDWGEYRRPPAEKQGGKKREDAHEDESSDDDNGEYDDYDDESSDDEYGEYDDFDDDEYGAYVGRLDSIVPDADRYNQKSSYNQKNKEKDDPWDAYSGENVGWQFDADTRFSKGEIAEGWNPMRQGDLPNDENVSKAS